MSTISVKWQNANSAVSKYASHRQELSSAMATVRSVKSYRCMRGRNFTEIYRALDRVISRMEDEKNDIRSLENGLSDILKAYEACETKLVGQIKGGTPEETENPFAWSWKDTWKVVSKAGIIGSLAAAVGGIVTGGWTASTVISSLKNIVSAIGDVSVAATNGTKTYWEKALFGMNEKDASGAGNNVKVAAKWAGYALTLASNIVDNVEEFKGQEGQTGRMLAEIGIETAVDIGVGALATAGVTAVASGLVTAGVITAAPVVLVGVGAAGVTWAANGICKWATGGKDIAETVSDFACDLTENLGNAAVKVKEGFNAIANWGQSLFSFGFA